MKLRLMSVLVAGLAVTSLTTSAMAEEFGGMGGGGRGEMRQKIKNMTPEEKKQWKQDHPEAAAKMEAAKEKWAAMSPEEKKAAVEKMRERRAQRGGGRMGGRFGGGAGAGDE